MRDWFGRLRGALRDLGRALLWAWHESFGYHDPRCVEQHFGAGVRSMTLECDCGAQWIRHPDDLELEP